jgi:protein SCO1
VAAGLAALVLACRSGEPGAEREATGWRAELDRWTYPQPVPSVPLIDQDGRAFELAELAGHHVLLGFIFTRCPQAEACPLTTEIMRRVQAEWRRLDDDARRGHSLRLLSVTLDPAFDTPERLRAYALERGLDLSSWTLATGPEELVTEALPSLFNVLALPRAPGDIQHTVKLALLAPGLRIAAEWKENAARPEEILGAVLGSPRR